MTVLITGGTGFIGSHLAAEVMAGGTDVALLVRNPEKAKAVFGNLGVEPPELRTGDATDPRAVRSALVGCDAVVHAAAVVAMKRSESQAARKMNTKAGEVVLGEAAEAGCTTIIHISSVSVLDLRTSPMTVESPLRETGGGYSRSKTDLEIFARGMQAAGAPLYTTYPGGVFGPYAPTLTAVHMAAQTWLKSTPMMPSGINIVDVRDLALMHSALLKASRTGVADDIPKRLAMGGHHSPWSDLYDIIDDVTGQNAKRVPVSGAMLRGLGSIVDATKLELPLDFPLSNEAMTDATMSVPIDSTPTIEALGVDFRPLAETVSDGYRWMAEQGHVPADRVRKLL